MPENLTISVSSDKQLFIDHRLLGFAHPLEKVYFTNQHAGIIPRKPCYDSLGFKISKTI